MLRSELQVAWNPWNWVYLWLNSSTKEWFLNIEFANYVQISSKAGNASGKQRRVWHRTKYVNDPGLEEVGGGGGWLKL